MLLNYTLIWLLMVSMVNFMLYAFFLHSLALKSVDKRHTGLFLDSQLHSIELYNYLYAVTCLAYWCFVLSSDISKCKAKILLFFFKTVLTIMVPSKMLLLSISFILLLLNLLVFYYS